MSRISKNLFYNEFGKPQEVLNYRETNLPNLSEGDVLLEMQYANINPSDLGMIGGSYGKLLELPATAGREGVAKVVETKGDTGELQAGDIVRIPETAGTWRTHLVTEAEKCLKIPSEIDAQQAATLFINPATAFMLLEQFVDLKPGDWIIQNAANSQVGLWVIQLAKARGIRSLNIVRREGLEDDLTKLGADHVIVENKDYPKTIKELTGGAKPKLALNSIGGESVINMIKCLADSGTCVTFGGMVGDLVRFPTRFLIFNDVQLRGFWMDKWMRTHSIQEQNAMYQNVFDVVIKNGIKTPIEAIYSLDNFVDALDHFQKPRMGKVLLKP